MSILSFDILKDKQEQWSRLIQLLTTLFKYGFEDFLDSTGLKKMIPKSLLRIDDESTRIVDLSQSERIRLALESLGTTYVKFGQSMSVRQDLFSDDLIEELEKLQDGVKQIPDFNLKSFLKKELGDKVDELFYSIDDEPLAAASIAQVYKAKLNNEHKTEVILKVKRPGIDDMVHADIAVLNQMAHFLENNVESARRYQLVDLVESFEDAILKEIQFSNEVDNGERFYNQFIDDNDVVVPKVYRELCTDELIVMDAVKGTKVSDIDQLDTLDLNRKKLAKKGVKVFFKQIMENGFYHADPHPGNFFILDNGQISFIDFGMMGVILPSDREDLTDFLFAIAQKDPDELMRILKIIAKKIDIPDEKKLTYQLHDLISQFEGGGLKDIDISDLVSQLRKILTENNIEMPSYLFQLLKTLMIVEGVGRKLDPEFNIMTELEGYSQELIWQKINPKRIKNRSFKMLRQIDRFTKDLPADLNEIIGQLKKGEMKFEMEIKDRRNMEKSINKVANRLVIAILIAALSIGSAMIVGTKMPPLVYDVPLLGIIGFIISGLLSVFIVFTIIKRDLF